MVKVNQYMHKRTNNSQSGIAAIFTVVFFTILISVIILSFVNIVSQYQRQVTNSDLSNSAYDSAEAGIEDAKRGLEKYRLECVKTTTPAANCSDLYTNAINGALSGAECDSFQRLDPILGLNIEGSEVKVATNSEDDSLQQAYTCLKVQLATDDYIRQLGSNQNILIPLKTVNDQPFNEIEINWFNQEDSNNPVIPSDTTSFDLPKNEDWPGSTPPIVRSQIIAVERGAANIDNIDNDAKTVFLFPSSTPSSNLVDVRSADATRKSQKYSPVAAQCLATTYACGVMLTNYQPIGGGTYDYYLRLSPIYNNASIQVRLFDLSAGPNPIKFDGVEPIVDSTGRANDVFRRIVSRVIFDDESSTLNGGSGFDITQGICKQFELADLPAYYQPHCSSLDLVNE